MARRQAFKNRLGARLYEIPGFNRKMLDMRKALKEVKKALHEKGP